MDNLTNNEKKAIIKAILSREFQMLIGSEDWDLTAEEEISLWSAIKKFVDQELTK